MALNNSDIVRAEENIKAVNTWSEGGAGTTATMANGRKVPSPLKLIADAKLFKAPIAWAPGLNVTDATQSYTHNDVVYAPQPTLLPFTTPGAFDSNNWYVLQGTVESELIQEFDTVNDMETSTNLIVGQTVICKGYYSVFDGGGNMGVVVPAATGTADGGKFFDIASGVQVEMNISNDVTARQFGAKLDGSDDTAALANYRAFIVGGGLSDDVTQTRGKIILSDTNWYPGDDPIDLRSTPTTAMMTYGGHYNELGAAGRNYKWGINSWMTNPSTAPVTSFSAVTHGYKVRSVDATSRQFGADGDSHALELICGQWASRANVDMTSGSNVLTVTSIIDRGARFCVGDDVEGTGIPVGSVITSITDSVTANTVTGQECETVSVDSAGAGYVVGDILTMTGGTFTRPCTIQVKSVSGGGYVLGIVTDGGDYSVLPTDPVSLSGGSGAGATVNTTFITAGYGFPSSITIDMNATVTGNNQASCVGADTQNISCLISGSGNGGPDRLGNQNGRAIQVQAYGTASFRYGLVFTGTGIRTDGAGIRYTFNDALHAFSVESSNFNGNIFNLQSTTVTDSVIECSSVDAQYVMNVFSSDYSSCIRYNNVNCTDAVIKIDNTNSNYGVRFHSANTFAFGAIYLDGQDIGSDTATGMKIGRTNLQKLAFWGKTPVIRPNHIPDPSGGATVDTEARSAIDDILVLLETVGLMSEA